jgi:NagD protein
MERPPKNYLIDMDGVLVRGNVPIPGAIEFLERLTARGAKFLILTNNSIYTPRDLQLRLQRIGLDVPDGRIYTSALATAKFLHAQRRHGLRDRRGGPDHRAARDRLPADRARS